MDMDWNKLKVQKRSYMDIVKERLGAPEGNGGEHPAGLRNTFKRLVGRGQEAEKKGLERKTSKGYTEQYVTDQGKIIEVPCMYALMMYTPLSFFSSSNNLPLSYFFSPTKSSVKSFLGKTSSKLSTPTFLSTRTMKTVHDAICT